MNNEIGNNPGEQESFEAIDIQEKQEEKSNPYLKMAIKLRLLAEHFEQKAETYEAQEDTEFEKRQDILIASAEDFLEKINESLRKLKRGELSLNQSMYYLQVPPEAYNLGVSNQMVEEEYRGMIYGVLGVEPGQVDELKKQLETKKMNSPQVVNTSLDNVLIRLGTAGFGDEKIREGVLVK